jgi:hypothetical protein
MRMRMRMVDAGRVKRRPMASNQQYQHRILDPRPV